MEIPERINLEQLKELLEFVEGSNTIIEEELQLRINALENNNKDSPQ